MNLEIRVLGISRTSDPSISQAARFGHDVLLGGFPDNEEEYVSLFDVTGLALLLVVYSKHPVAIVTHATPRLFV